MLASAVRGFVAGDKIGESTQVALALHCFGMGSGIASLLAALLSFECPRLCSNFVTRVSHFLLGKEDLYHHS